MPIWNRYSTFKALTSKLAQFWFWLCLYNFFQGEHERWYKVGVKYPVTKCSASLSVAYRYKTKRSLTICSWTDHKNQKYSSLCKMGNTNKKVNISTIIQKQIMWSPYITNRLDFQKSQESFLAKKKKKREEEDKRKGLNH